MVAVIILHGNDTDLCHLESYLYTMTQLDYKIGVIVRSHSMLVQYSWLTIRSLRIKVLTNMQVLRYISSDIVLHCTIYLNVLLAN